ncbi:hypothetical protein OSB04_003429 [Centaurea solstitialis]|uniref:HSF-type DNA-binding domain-containing protein n=1 Tax=Centaurea solstitialis TaxID=347529 RepID=A0AA38TUV2_9ASTR|nr:hypothetical protein OSB04_003429 [Centaurea solstitialis]
MALMLDNNSCEGILLSLDSHKAMPAPFLTKTYQLVDDPATDHIVSWGKTIRPSSYGVRPSSLAICFRITSNTTTSPPLFANSTPMYVTLSFFLFLHLHLCVSLKYQKHVQPSGKGFRKIVPDRWEFANEFFKKGEKHLLCEIHRRKTSQPQVGLNHHHHFTGIGGGNGFFSYRDSISPTDSDEHLFCDSPPPLSSSTTATAPTTTAAGLFGIFPTNTCVNNRGNSVTALSEDNERLRRSNNMLMSELAHMRKLYNDVIYYVQNHVKPVTPSNAYPSSLLGPSSTNSPLMVQKQQHPTSFFHGGGNANASVIYPNKPQQLQRHDHSTINNIVRSDQDKVNVNRTKLFGVPLLSKKRLHPEYGSPNTMVEAHKARLILEKDDLGLKLMPPSPC